MALEIPKTPDLWRWRHPETALLWRLNSPKYPIYGVGNTKKCRFMALETPLNHLIMALEISKTPDLWR